MKKHILKILPQYFEAVINGCKNFEIRKNDRFFKLNDILFLKEYNPIEKKYTGCTAKCKVIYILYHEDFPEGIQDGYCVMGIKFLGYADFNELIEG